MSHITIQHVTKHFGNDKTTGIHDINLEIAKGEFVSIVGPFGSGKTTLLRAMGGLTDTYEGSIQLGGMHPKQALSSGTIGYGFQQPTLLTWRSVIQNIMLPQELVGEIDISYAKSLLDIAGLSKIQDKRVHELSGGTRQLVSILRSLALRPSILMLDEPFSSIDEMTKDTLNERLRTIHHEHKLTTILVTHSLHEAVYLSDRVIVLSHAPGGIKKIVPIKYLRPSIASKYSTEANKLVRQIRRELVRT